MLALWQILHCASVMCADLSTPASSFLSLYSQIRALLGIHDRSDGNTKVGDRSPEIYSTILISKNYSACQAKSFVKRRSTLVT